MTRTAVVELINTSRRRGPLHIGIVAPGWVPIPPPAYGGIEQVVATLAAGLAERGHRVRLVAAPGSDIPGVECVSPLPRVPSMIGDPIAERRHTLGAVEAVEDCDIVLDNSSIAACLLLRNTPRPVLHVVHGPLVRPYSAHYHAVTRRTPNVRLIAISEAQRRLAPGLPFSGVCHNGIDLTGVPFRSGDDGYLAFLGRMSPDKGAAQAIAIAREAGMPLLISAKCREPEEVAYFERQVAPYLGDGIEWLGELGAADKYRLLANARALLFPIQWEEPFGMVMIEALATGTPVLAIGRGAVPEVVIDGRTGFIRRSEHDLAACVPLLGSIDPQRCRADVEERFDAGALVDRYEALLYAHTAARVPRRPVAEVAAGTA